MRLHKHYFACMSQDAKLLAAGTEVACCGLVTEQALHTRRSIGYCAEFIIRTVKAHASQAAGITADKSVSVRQEVGRWVRVY